jgi:hypothetical protein
LLANQRHRVVPVAQWFAAKQNAHRPHPRGADARIRQRDPEFGRILGKVIADRQLHEWPDSGGGLLTRCL